MPMSNGDQRLRSERLFEVVCRTVTHRQNGGHDIRVRGNQHDGKVRMPGLEIAQKLVRALPEDVRAEAAVDLKLRAQRAADRGALLLVFLVLPGVVGICIGILLSEAIDGLGPLL